MNCANLKKKKKKKKKTTTKNKNSADVDVTSAIDKVTGAGKLGQGHQV